MREREVPEREKSVKIGRSAGEVLDEVAKSKSLDGTT